MKSDACLLAFIALAAVIQWVHWLQAGCGSAATPQCTTAAAWKGHATTAAFLALTATLLAAACTASFWRRWRVWALCLYRLASLLYGTRPSTVREQLLQNEPGNPAADALRVVFGRWSGGWRAALVGCLPPTKLLCIGP